LLDAAGWGAADALVKNRHLIVGDFVLLLAGALVLAGRLAIAPGFRLAIAALPAREMDFLVIGAVLITGCFFAGQNVGYRGILLLFALPGVLALAHSASDRRTRAVFRCTAGALIFVMWWMTFPQAIVYFGKAFSIPHQRQVLTYCVAWIVQEIAWWWLVTVFLAVVFRFAIGSAVGQAVFAALRPHRAGTGIFPTAPGAPMG
jgi:hypothetical protein